MNLPTAVIAAMIATGAFDPNHQEPDFVAVINKKEVVKISHAKKPPKPGKGKPARGYDPVTKTWKKGE